MLANAATFALVRSVAVPIALVQVQSRSELTAIGRSARMERASQTCSSSVAYVPYGNRPGEVPVCHSLLNHAELLDEKSVKSVN